MARNGREIKKAMVTLILMWRQTSIPRKSIASKEK